MKSVNHEGFSDPIGNIPLDDEHAHILVEYYENAISLRLLIETIEISGAEILETIPLREEPGGPRLVLFKLDVEDARNVVISLSKHPLANLKGYNAKSKIARKRRNP
jgi:hypothetical protein